MAKPSLFQTEQGDEPGLPSEPEPRLHKVPGRVTKDELNLIRRAVCRYLADMASLENETDELTGRSIAAICRAWLKAQAEAQSGKAASMMAEHTKGPWVARNVSRGRIAEIGPENRHGSTLFVRIAGIDIIDEEDEANAHLLAAAPALLNALTRYRVQHDQGMHPSYRPCVCQVCQQANEAIKAAKGGS